jgi:mono/diheme cytochrome c family protein
LTPVRRVTSVGLGAAIVIWLAAGSAALTAQSQPPTTFDGLSGRDIYEAGCITCHGPDGTGMDQAIVGFSEEIPDFTDCEFATPEPDSDWLAMVHEGGTVRAFPRRMPSFKDLLGEDEIDRVVAYLRAFCANPAWPRGDLNLPRPLVTEKAFPENETVVTVSGDSGAVGSDFLYERRLGARSQFEVEVPFDVQRGEGGQYGLGDVKVALKHALYHDIERGQIFSVGGEAVLPTGKETAGLGHGFTIFEPFAAFGQILPSDSFVQVHTGMEFPTDTDAANKEAFWRVAAGRSWMQNRWGRAWTPMFELLAVRELADGESTLWDVVPEMQVTLSKRQHIMVSLGVQLPVNERDSRGKAVLGYFLWDWFDGGLFEGWK